MTIVALIIGLLTCALGALGLASPARMLDVVGKFENLPGLYTAAAIRIVLGIALLYAAPASRFPAAINVLGVIILIAGFILPIIGLERFCRIVAWWCSQKSSILRVWAGFAFAFGLFLSYALTGHGTSAAPNHANARAMPGFPHPTSPRGRGA